MSGARTTPVLGYVIRMFPQLSETFVAGEIRELERRGTPLHVFSYRRPRAEVPHELVRSIRTPITYLPDPLGRNVHRLLAAQPRAIRDDAERWRETVRYVLGYTWRERNADTWRRFVQSVYLARAVRDAGVEHLHAHFAHGATRIAMLTSRLTGLPFSFTAHARDIYTNDPRILRERIEAASFVVTCTGANVDYMRGLVDEDQHEKIHLGYHGIDVTKFVPAPRSVPSKPRILAVGRLVPKKGLENLVEACALLRDEGVDFECRIVGYGPERERLEREIAGRRLGDVVELAGKRSQEGVLEEYREATVFALPCQVMGDGDRDGIPNVLVEAMSVGLPVVTSRISGIPELVTHEHDGLLVEQRDPRGLARSLQRLLTDEAERRRISENARETAAERFDRERNVVDLIELFRARPAEAPVRLDEAPVLASAASGGRS